VLPYFDSVRPESISGQVLDQLLALGWYRMHQTLFTCSHIGMNDEHRVHWLRYDIGQIKKHASHQRIRRKNKSFQFTIQPLKSVDEAAIELYDRYYASIDFDGASSIQQCLWGDEDTASTIFDTKCVSIFDQSKLIAVGYFDCGNKAAASILHGYHPDYSRYSLGKYLILLTLDYLRTNDYRYYYPGYVIEDLDKMDYKLFLGKDQAEYFKPEILSWQLFKDELLVRDSIHKKLKQ
jgi:leucyl-tRNA---protein transferase